MATIGSNAAPAAAPFATNTANPAEHAANDSGDSPNDFLRLVNGMIQGNTTPDQLPSNLVEFLLTGDESALEGLEGDGSDAEDEDGDEVGALSAMLAGVAALNPLAGGGARFGGLGGEGSIDGSGRRGGEALQPLLGLTGSQGATGALGANGVDAASGANAAGATAANALDADAAFLTALQDAAAANGAGDGGPEHATSASPLQSLLQAHRAAETAPLAASAEVRTPVGAPGWSDEIGTHLTMMAAHGREAASLRLSPEHLGPLEIQISMKDGEASVVFGATNADTRSALEQSLPRLREMFASQGLVLGDANVSRDTPRDGFKPSTFANAERGSSDARVDADVKPITLSRLGLVDTYV